MKAITILFFFVFVFSMQIFAQTNQSNNPPVQPLNPIDQISADLTKVSKSLQVFNKNFKAFLEILPQGIKFSEKQQNFLLAFEVLNRAEQRVQILQKFQIELTEKQADVKNRLTRVEEDITPEGIERSVAFLGTTKTEEIRESRRKTLEAEKTSLRQLLAQINQNLAETSNELRQALSFVKRLRDKILPQIEQEFSDLK
ncbi:MAG: hypothetical protein M3Q33_00385 [Acidobacteriota bacterium]|nr:hypothetical protein [Acidobacteriota bacterium]